MEERAVTCPPGRLSHREPSLLSNDPWRPLAALAANHWLPLRRYCAIENFSFFGALGPWCGLTSGILAAGSGFVPRRMYSVTGL